MISYPSEAAVKAFENFAGNIREQHDAKKAVGKMVDFKEDTYFDPDTNKMYARRLCLCLHFKGCPRYLGEGYWTAPSQDFPSQERLKKRTPCMMATLRRAFASSKTFTLSELSLVDVPANQFANVVSIQKSGEVTGMLAKALIENVYYCGHDDVVQLSSTVKSACPRCSGAMENIGFVESNDPDKAQMVKGILTTVRKNKEVENMSESTEATPETPEAVEETVKKR